ncbi:MAG TPA: hypothetical protein VMV41_12330, partial [Cellulomonadaceae bacterium]|nr:hypothetical protein [Cellulomonadaceae bacterium]
MSADPAPAWWRAAATRVAELPAPWCIEPYLLGEHALATVVSAWGTSTAVVALMEGLGRDRGLFGVGRAEDVAAVLSSVARRDASAAGGARYATITRGAVELLAPDVRDAVGFGGSGSSWDWMWTDARLNVEDHSGAERLPLG